MPIFYEPQEGEDSIQKETDELASKFGYEDLQKMIQAEMGDAGVTGEKLFVWVQKSSKYPDLYWKKRLEKKALFPLCIGISAKANDNRPCPFILDISNSDAENSQKIRDELRHKFSIVQEMAKRWFERTPQARENFRIALKNKLVMPSNAVISDEAFTLVCDYFDIFKLDNITPVFTYEAVGKNHPYVVNEEEFRRSFFIPVHKLSGVDAAGNQTLESKGYFSLAAGNIDLRGTSEMFPPYRTLLSKGNMHPCYVYELKQNDWTDARSLKLFSRFRIPSEAVDNGKIMEHCVYMHRDSMMSLCNLLVQSNAVLQDIQTELDSNHRKYVAYPEPCPIVIYDEPGNTTRSESKMLLGIRFIQMMLISSNTRAVVPSYALVYCVRVKRTSENDKTYLVTKKYHEVDTSNNTQLQQLLRHNFGYLSGKDFYRFFNFKGFLIKEVAD